MVEMIEKKREENEEEEEEPNEFPGHCCAVLPHHSLSPHYR